MTRPRSDKADNWLPKYVYLYRGDYVLRQKRDGVLTAITLCPATASKSEVWAKFEAVTEDGTKLDSVIYVAEKYLLSGKYQSLAPRTQKDYAKYHARLMNTPMQNGRNFGQMPRDKVTPGLLRKYLDKRESKIPGEGKTQGNREIAYLSAVFSWAFSRDLVTSNPCIGVEKNKVTRKKRYVSDEDYHFMLSYAAVNAPYYVPIAMELAYLCRFRKCEVLDIMLQDLTETGLVCRRRKGSKDNHTLWSPRLTAAVRAARAVPSTISSVYLLHDREGQPIKESAIDSAWQRMMVKAKSEGFAGRFTFHNLKHKGISDTKGDKLKSAGHRSASMLSIYDLKMDDVEATK